MWVFFLNNAHRNVPSVRSEWSNVREADTWVRSRGPEIGDVLFWMPKDYWSEQFSQLTCAVHRESAIWQDLRSGLLSVS